MSGRRAKVFRREAERLTVGAPLCAYVRGPGGGLALAPACTRAEYRAAKAAHRQAARRGPEPRPVEGRPWPPWLRWRPRVEARRKGRAA